ncbi:hypothetical protein [Pseudorhodoplanes sp.]|uniref:hypothetical protein n=1 Tax=Pseudorhodoplanes sp. TaxID=1934341 RepID=UPI003D0C2B20
MCQDSAIEFRFDRHLKLSGDTKILSAIEHRVGSRRIQKAKSTIIANILYAHAQHQHAVVFYSRDRNFYTDYPKRYRPDFYTYAVMMGAIDSLVKDGFLEEQRTSPSAIAKHRSRIRPSNKLLGICADCPPAFVFDDRESIVLKDTKGKYVGYRDTQRIIDMRRDVQEANEFLASAEICVGHPGVIHKANGFVQVDNLRIDPRRKFYHRVFNGAWDRGGRWYGPFWQQLPSELRANLLIDGETVIESDFRACQFRLLCARAKLALPFDDPSFDPYDIWGFDRSEIKLAFNIMLNASKPAHARSAISQELSVVHSKASSQKALSLMNALRGKYPALGPFWCSGSGLSLQYQDAQICSEVMRRLRRENIPVLSVHDSFIVPSSHDGKLADIMEEEMQNACAKAAVT